jgi:hypothetical protein
MSSTIPLSPKNLADEDFMLALDARGELAMSHVLRGIDDGRAELHAERARKIAANVSFGAGESEVPQIFVGEPVLVAGWNHGQDLVFWVQHL